MKTLKILLIDDHKMIRDGLRSMLESQENDYKFVIDEAETGEEGVIKAKAHPDIIIMDYQLPKMSGAEAVAVIMKHNSKARIIALSNYNEYMYIDKMVKNGVKGFILKNIGPEELIKAIETILSGARYFSTDVAMKLMTFDTSSEQIKEITHGYELELILSTREMEVLKLIANEHTSEEIAKDLNISKRTVDAHRQNIMNKLGVKSAAGLVKYAVLLLPPTSSNSDKTKARS
jgi:DNA-binding NarL/FixJ family response regulator